MVAMLLSLTHVHCPKSREVREADACSKLRVWEVNALHLVKLSSCKPAQQSVFEPSYLQKRVLSRKVS